MDSRTIFGMDIGFYMVVLLWSLSFGLASDFDRGSNGGFCKLGVLFVGVLTTRALLLCGLYWGSCFLETSM